MATFIALVSALLVSSVYSAKALSSNYYDHTCPQAESMVSRTVKKAMLSDKTVPAALLRMHFHDCFIRVTPFCLAFLLGCDASVLLNSTSKNQAEKDGPPNISLHAFYVIDIAKEEIEASCPGVVSCADILAFAARDAVSLSGGPTWDVPKGRLDGRISKANDTLQLPFPTFNISQLQQSFAQRGLSLDDLVALSEFAASLQSVCPMHNKVKNAGANMDTTPVAFDNGYFELLLQGKSLFSSDQALLTNPKTKALVSKYACSQEEFEKAFVKAMIRMSSITGGEEIRRHCRVVR
ncbi:hem peroxidase [Dillenia turbinata]|uniref:Peroxidase n=1 Tax=Dillenia turbinata TaxID=194707 RepID=A0AAN8VSC0_9MAGN